MKSRSQFANIRLAPSFALCEHPHIDETPAPEPKPFAIEWSKTAAKVFRRLPRNLREDIVADLTKLVAALSVVPELAEPTAFDPTIILGLDVVVMINFPAAGYRLRVRQYRVLFNLYPVDRVVLLVDVGPRGSIYE